MGWYPIRRWDWLQHTGVVVFLVALYFARQVPTQFLEVLSRLPLAASADGNEVSVELAKRVATQIRVSAQRYGLIGVAVGLIVMTVVWIWAFERAWHNSLFWVELALAAVAGYVVGGFVAYARIGRLLDELGRPPVPQPGHPDGAAGFRPVGALFVRQASIVAAIGLFAGIWWLLISNNHFLGARYGRWQNAYLVLVAVCLLLEWLTLLVPLQYFHQQMILERSRLQPEADTCARKVGTIDAKLAHTTSSEDAEQLSNERDRALNRWRAITEMPAWPIDGQLRKRFRWNNVVILLPLVLQWLKAPRLLQELGQVLGKLN